MLLSSYCEGTAVLKALHSDFRIYTLSFLGVIKSFPIWFPNIPPLTYYVYKYSHFPSQLQVFLQLSVKKSPRSLRSFHLQSPVKNITPGLYRAGLVLSSNQAQCPPSSGIFLTAPPHSVPPDILLSAGSSSQFP